MTLVLAILLDGLVYASWLFVIAAGLTLIYGVMKILNMAHGSFYAIGAYSAASMIGWYFAGGYPPWGSYLLLLLCALVAGVVVGIVLERGVLRVMYGRDEVVMILVTYGLLLILEDVIKLVWGVDAYFAFQPYSLLGRTRFGDLIFANYDLGLIAVAAAVGGLLWFGLNKTRQGKFLRVVIFDREVAGALGINVRRTFMITFTIGTILGTLAGALTAPGLSVVPGMGIEVIVRRPRVGV